MSNAIAWTDSALPVGLTIDQLLYRVRRHDEGGLIFDSVTLDELLEEGEEQITLDAMVTPYNKLNRKAAALQNIMTRAVSELQVVAMQVSDPFKQNGTANVVVLFELSDGQTVSVYFHNPDATPGKILPTDELVSWKWLLNKKDITIVVAPERGNDLAVREVGRRIMKLAAKNSAAFARVNAKRADRMQNIASMRGEIEQLETELGGLLKEIEVVELEAENRALAESQKPTADKGLAALNSVRQFLSRGQFKAIAEAMKGEEGRFVIDKAVVLAQLIDGMAKTYEQDGKDDPTAYLHYFKGSADWHITEKDASGKGTEQAFGLSDLGQGGELGYISIDELVRNNAELDLHFEPKPLSAVRRAEPVVEPEPVETITANGNSYTEISLEPDDARRMLDSALQRHDGNVFEAVKDLYQNELKGRFVRTKIGDVLLTGAGWTENKIGLKKNELRAKVIPYIPVILKTGDVGEPQELYKERGDGIVRFQSFMATVDLGDVMVKAVAKVGERADHRLFYHLSTGGILDSANKKAPPSQGLLPDISGASENSPGATLDSTLAGEDDEINLVILEVIDKATGQRLSELEDAPVEAEAPAPQPEVADYSQFPVIASDPIWGDIIEVPTVHGEMARVARAQLMDPVRTLLAQYTKAGKRKAGYGIHRDNLLIHGNTLSEAAQLEQDLRDSGLWEVARFPRSPEQQMKLLGQGYSGYVKDERTGEMIPSPLGLVWAKPIPQAIDAPDGGPQSVEAVARWLVALGWSVSAPDERGDVMASLGGMSLTLGASPSGQLDYDGEPLDVLLTAKEAAYQIHAEYRYGDPRENRERLGIDDPADEDDADFEESSWHSEAFNQSAIIVKDAAERLGGRVSFGDFSNSISGGLFDSVAAVPYGICAQIGSGGKGIGRAAIEEDGKVLVYVGLSGSEVVGVDGQPAEATESHADIVAMLEALFRQEASASPEQIEAPETPQAPAGPEPTQPEQAAPEQAEPQEPEQQGYEPEQAPPQERPESQPAAAEAGGGTAPARDLFQAVIDGSIAAVAPELEGGMLDEGLIRRLQEAGVLAADDAELAELFKRAVDAVTAAVMKEMEGAQ